MNRQPAFNRAVLQLMAGAVFALGTASAQAQALVSEAGMGFSASTTSTVSRAEVLADLKLYQESGLSEAERVAREGGPVSPALQVSRARYEALRRSKRYAELVAEFAAKRGEPAPALASPAGQQQATSASPTAPVGLTRAEVLADLKVYIESGLADAERTALQSSHFGPAFEQARQRYLALRHGERYAALVAEYAARRGESPSLPGNA
jgi:hypothetical protein